jgi:hypothetical protein
MNLIPEHCIDIFKTEFTTFPSVLEILPVEDEKVVKIDEFFAKSHILWREEIYGNANQINKSNRLIEYDPTGIFIYIHEKNHIFILTTENRMDVSKFTLNKLIKHINK